MGKPLSLPNAHHNGANGTPTGRSAQGVNLHLRSSHAAEDAGSILDGMDELGEPGRSGSQHGRIQIDQAATDAAEVEHLRTENAQLRALCLELEQALQEAAQQAPVDQLEQQVREYEAIVGEKNEMIRQLHQQLQESQAVLEEVEAQASQPAPQRPCQGPAPAEDELLALSEELERERRQLQEDEQSLMDQMREMEVSMARERAEMARQRNDLQRLQSEIRHELDRLERNGALQSKIEGLKNKLQDATTRRGAAPASGAAAPQQSAPAAPAQPAAAPPRKEGLMGRLFGQK
jgi:hypothetical protein